MFTGIVEQVGLIVDMKEVDSNIDFIIKADFTDELKIDQSVAHNGCCLTVTSIEDDQYAITAIKETLDKTNLGGWKVGTKVNLERCMPMNARLDGHIVQGHVDTTATCIGRENQDGSWKFTFQYNSDDLTVEKGSVTINGVSLTVVDSKDDSFSVCIIPFTLEHTNFQDLNINDIVNLEFDIIGKYVAKPIKRN